MATVRLSSKGQVVIPARIRNQLGLRTGQTLEIRKSDAREIVLTIIEERPREAEAMLRQARAWSQASERDLVRELHERRALER